MTGGDISKRELDRAFPETYEVESNPDYNTVTANSHSEACCRFCRTDFETVTARRIHNCVRSPEGNFDEADGQPLTIQPGIHELGAHLMWDANGLSPYFAIVANFDRVLGKSLYFDLDGETWELNHDEKKIKYWQGKLAAREQDAFSAFNEYQIGVRTGDNVGRRYVTFQFRPGLPNATHVDTGKPIGGLPEDCTESIRVQVHSANVNPEEIIDILHALMDAMTIDTAHFRREDIHERSRCYNLALYVRMTRLESEEKIVSRNGLLEQLALISSQQRGRGEYKWDNEEIIGHRTAVALDERSLGKLLPDQYVGKLLKSSHMKNPTAVETGASTTSPKLEVQYSTEYSRPKRQSVPWRSAHEYDLTEIRDELDEYLVNALNWAGVTTRADERIYVSDEYWTVKETERPLQLYENPLENVSQYERDLAVHHLTSAELTNSERRVLETIADGGQKLHHSEIADRSGTSSSTVYRTAGKLDGVLRKIHGQIDFEDTIVREKFQQLLSRIDDVVEWAETGVEALAREEGLLTSDSALARWARTFAVDVAQSYDCGAAFDRIEIQGGEFDRYQIIKILRRGYEAARAAGPQTAARFLEANFVWYEPNTGRVEAVSAFTYYGTSLRVLGTPVRSID